MAHDALVLFGCGLRHFDFAASLEMPVSLGSQLPRVYRL